MSEHPAQRLQRQRDRCERLVDFVRQTGGHRLDDFQPFGIELLDRSFGLVQCGGVDERPNDAINSFAGIINGVSRTR